jgi:predicted lipoprotein with Yx(FWY)xxD motif
MSIELNASERRHVMRIRWLVPAGAAAAVLVIAACGSSSPGNGGSGGSGGSGSSPAAQAASGTTLKTTKISGATVLTNAKGFTLYWFVRDTPNKSNCDASCLHYWPPVTGSVTAGSGVTGHLGTITGTNGTKQATWNGHPLYTYVGDTGPGMAKGNGLNISGGVWHEVTLTGHAAPAASPKASSGGGYGY